MLLQYVLSLVLPTQLFTSLGTFTLGFFEQDVSAEVRMRKPGLYKSITGREVLQLLCKLSIFCVFFFMVLYLVL